MKPRRDWTSHDAATRGAFYACVSLPADATMHELREQARCTEAVAFRVWVIRRAADSSLITWWLEDRLTLSRLWACIGFAPLDGDAQKREAAACSDQVRAVYRTPGEEQR